MNNEGEQLFEVTIEKDNRTGGGFGVGHYTVTITELVDYVREFPNARVVGFEVS